MKPEIRITPEYVRALDTDQVMVPHSRFDAFKDFGSKQLGCIVGRALHDDAEVRVLPEDRVIDHNELVEFLARFPLRIDIDMAELYALGMVSWLNRGSNSQIPPLALLLRKAITERVHQIIESRPEFLHPKLRFALDVNDSSETWMLRFLLASRVALDADRLHAMSIGGGAGQEMLTLALSPGMFIGALLFDETVHSSAGCASSAAAIFRAGYPITRISEHNVNPIIEMCATGVAGAQWQFDKAVEMLRAIEAAQDAAGGDDHRLSWAVSGQDAVYLNDFCWSSARRVHPVTTLIYETMMRVCNSGPNRAADVDGFPGVPFSIMAERINAILKPEGRFPLGKLSGLNALKLVTLCPAASKSTAAGDYWVNRSEGAKRVASLTNSPMDIVDWACQKTDEDGVRLTLAEIDPIQSLLVTAIGAGAASEIRARVAHRDMAATIAGAGHVQDAAPRRRRSPKV